MRGDALPCNPLAPSAARLPAQALPNRLPPKREPHALPSAQLADPEGQSAPGGERDGGIDARRFGAHVLRAEAAEQDGEGEHVLHLAHGAANAGTLASTK